MTRIEKLEQKVERAKEILYKAKDKQRRKKFLTLYRIKDCIKPKKLRKNQKQCEAYWSCCWLHGRCFRPKKHDMLHVQDYCGELIWFHTDAELYLRESELHSDKG